MEESEKDNGLQIDLLLLDSLSTSVPTQKI
jgi:hypothetical protein